MPKVVITHNVVDIERWVEEKAGRADTIGGLGGSNVVDLVAHDGSKTVAVTFDTNDVNRFIEAIADPSPDLAAGMEQRGVLTPVTVFVES
jgi:hypothetical protein